MDPTSFSVPGAPPKASHVVDVTEATFATEVVDRSRDVPVVIDLWASWCAPCRQLGPVLEKLAAEGNGSWVLAKVDVDANPRIAQALQVQGIPAVKAIVGGQIVDEFTGAMPEPQIRQWLEGIGVGGGASADGASPADSRILAGVTAERRGDLEEARAAYDAVLAERPADPEALAGLARVELVTRARATDEAAMTARLAAAPDDVEAAGALADLDLLRGRTREAFGRLLDIVRRTSGPERDAARERLLRLFAAVPPDEPAVVSARRDLANALF
ncbi:MAG TPA: tetratricopeptide repeat protein [Frankiaceae bacterium]|nr:tetratricopeptide repeat protein [Frankiaceae bacterium]